jgi:hypothetical protein
MNTNQPENKFYDRKQIIKWREVEELIDKLIMDAEYHPYAIYGLMFLFGSIKKMVESGNAFGLDNIYTPALIKLYSLSRNIDQSIKRLTDNIHVPFRAADFTDEDHNRISEAFIKSETPAPSEPPSTDRDDFHYTGDLDIDNLALTLSGLINNPKVPEPITDGISQVMTDFFNEHVDQSDFIKETHSPEYIAKLLLKYKNE